jgi:fatty-acyl-CoA synthase
MAFEGLKTTARLVLHGLRLGRIKPDSRYSVGDRIEALANSRGDHPFVRFEGRSMSYGELNEQANRLAHFGLERGLRPGDVVALLMENRPEYVATWGGLAKIGVTSALLNTNLKGHALAHALEAGGTRRLLVGSECLEALATLGEDAPPGLQVWVAPEPDQHPALPAGALDLARELADQPAENPHASVRAEVRAGDPLAFIYTSGTTGLPKAAKMSHLRFTTTGVASQVAGFGAGDTMYCALPLYHSAGGAMAVMAVLNSGGTLALRRRFSASEFWHDVTRFRATAFQYIGEFCRYLLNQPERAEERSHRLRFAIGNGLRPDIWERFQERFALPRIVEFYGATEGNIALVNYDNRPGSVGKRPPAIVGQPRLIRYDVETDEHPRTEAGLCIECKPDEVGELVARIPDDPNRARGRFEGYTSKDATEKKILHDVFEPGDQYFRTGDLLRCDDRGYFYFIDRIGDTFRWKGENVSTQEVAEALTVFAGVELINVYGVEIPGHDGRAGMAALTMADGVEFDPNAFRELAERSLPSYARPVFVRIKREADLTGTFKLRKVDLQREGYDPAATPDPIYVRDDRAGSYVALTAERLEALHRGELRV